MLNHGEDVHHAGLVSILIHDQLHKPNHGIAQKSSHIDALIEKRPGIVTRLLDGHSIMGKSLALAYRSFVIDSANSPNKDFAERHFTKRNSFFFCLPSAIAREGEYLMVPPVL